jgi:hypothetical protein
MAQTVRSRTVANPGRRRSRAARKLSRKQIKFFGTPAQKAALRRNRPKAKHRRASRRRAASNPGEIIGYTLATNPAKKRGKSKMAKKQRRRRASSARVHRRRRPRAMQSNPHHRRRSRPRTNPRRRRRTVHHRRGNPGMTGGIGGLVTNAVFVIAGALGSKLLTQMVLGANNTGFVGYGGNAAAGAVLWFLADKVLKNRAAAHGILAGTAVQIVLRLINDYTPFGQYVANLGMGDYQAQAFVTPQILRDPYNSAAIKIPGAWLPPPALPPATAMPAAAGVHAGMGGDLYGGRSELYG